MFDIGFWEMTLVFLVALLVLGPERLPRAAKTVAVAVNKFRKLLASVRADVEREMGGEDLRREVQEQSRTLDELKALGRDLRTRIGADDDKAPPASGKHSDP